MSTHSKLTKLAEKALAQGQYPLAAATTHLMADLADINRQINLVGALHEVGYLQNSLSPYWKAFRTNEPIWVERCLSRLVTNDYDYWALAALLGCNGQIIIEMCLAMGFKSAALRFYQSYGKPDVHVNTLYLYTTGKVLHPVLEIGYDVIDGTAIDVGRARALSLENEHWNSGEFVGDGWLSLSLQAKLPYGSWRTANSEFKMKEEWLVQVAP
jgi:hypothetical protein